MQLEERLRGDSSSQAETRRSTVASPRETAVLRAVRSENEHLKQQLQVHPIPALTVPLCWQSHTHLCKNESKCGLLSMEHARHGSPGILIPS